MSGDDAEGRIAQVIADTEATYTGAIVRVGAEIKPQHRVIASALRARIAALRAPLVHGSDADWLLGQAAFHAQQILRLVQLYEDGEIGIDGAVEAIRVEAEMILTGPKDDDEPEAAEPPGPDE